MKRASRLVFAGILVTTISAPWAGIHASPADLAVDLTGRTVVTPDGIEIPVVGDPESGAVLDSERTAQCLETIDRAEAWPEAWLVVQDEAVSFDLVLFLRKDGDVIDAPLVVTLPRADRDHRALRDAVRSVTGERLPAKVRNLVTRGFRVRVETLYVYDPPPAEATSEGLLALLPAGSLLREATLVDLGDDAMHTLAVVMRDARFVPSRCDECGRAVGHLDAGTFRLILASADAIEAELDLEIGHLPRFRCEPGDEAVAPEDTATIRAWLSVRQPAPILDPADLDHDGRALEVAIPVVRGHCESPGEIVVSIDPSGPYLRVLD